MYEYDEKYLNSHSLLDAKELFNSKIRSWSGDLPKIATWFDINNQADPGVGYISPSTRREFYDSGFHGFFIKSTLPDNPPLTVADLFLPVEGYTNMLDYLSHNADVPISISIRDNRFHWWSNIPTSYGWQWPPYITNGKRTDGLHIGWEVNPTPPAEAGVTWNQPTAEPPFDEFYSYKLRYLTGNTGTSADAELTISPPPSVPPNKAGAMYLPLHSDTASFWTKGVDFEYNDSAKGWIDNYLTPNGLSPRGFLINAEDMPPHPEDNTLAKTKMSADYRFYDSLRIGDYYELASKGIREINDARAAQAQSLIPSWEQDCSCLYGFRSPQYFRLGFPASETFWKNGRKVSSICVYPYYKNAVSSTLKYSCYRTGYYMRDFAQSGIHLFQGWLCPSIDVSPGLTVSEMIMFTRLFMACGSYKLWPYVTWYSVYFNSHFMWSITSAYDDMQEYSDIILNGSNFIPPISISKNYKYWNTGTGAEVAYNYLYTNFYSKDYNGNDLDDNTWICCRIYKNKIMFFAGTTDKTQKTVSVLSPTGNEVSLLATPYGEIKVL